VVITFQLEELIVDNQQFDAKRREVEAWLGRMEAWLSRIRPVGMTADVLETQIREQKVKLCFTLMVFSLNKINFFLVLVFSC